MLIGIEWWHLRLNEARFSVDNTFYDTFKGYFNVIACFRPHLFSLCGKEQLGDFSKRLFVTDEGASCELETTFNLEYGKYTPSRVCFYMKCTVFDGTLFSSSFFSRQELRDVSSHQESSGGIKSRTDSPLRQNKRRTVQPPRLWLTAH